MTNRRTRIDTIAGQTATIAAAQRSIKPPKNVKLEKADKPFWESVIAEFARSEWSDHQLELAAMLARMMADLEREQRQVRIDGAVITDPKGKVCVNPRQSVVASLTTSIMNMRRNLSLNARAKGGDARDIAKRREIAKHLESEALDDDDLLGCQ